MSSTLELIRQAIQQQAAQDKLNVEQLTTIQLNEIPIKRITPQIKKLIQKCVELQTLSLSDCQLESLQNLPKLDLSAIDLSKNQLGDGQMSKLLVYGNLNQLLLGENKVSKLQTIKTLSQLSSLQQLELNGNPVAQNDEYKTYAFKNIQGLQYLDGADQEGNLLPDDQEQFDDDQDDQELQDQGQFDDDQDDEEFSDDEQQQPQPKKRR